MGKIQNGIDRPVKESVTARAADTEQILMMNVSTVTTEQSELSDTDVPSGEDSEFIDRPVTELVTAPAGSNIDFPNGEHSEFVDRPVTESVTAQTERNTNFPSEEDSEFFGRPVTEPVTSRAGSDTDLPSDEHSEFFGRPVTESVTAQAGSDTKFPNREYSEKKDIQYHCVTRASICKEENSSVNSGTDGVNSDIGVLADFSDYENDAQYTPEMLE